MAETSYRYDAFISYSHKDADWVRTQLLTRLEAAGMKVIIDVRDFEYGVPSIVNMERSVDESKHTIIVLTPAWVESEWANFESLLIHTDDPSGRRRRIIPLMLKKCQPPKRIHVLTHADFTDNSRHEINFRYLIKQLHPKNASVSNELNAITSVSTDKYITSLLNRLENQGFVVRSWSRPGGDDSTYFARKSLIVLVITRANTLTYEEFAEFCLRSYEFVQLLSKGFKPNSLFERGFHYFAGCFIVPIVVVNGIDDETLAYCNTLPMGSSGYEFFTQILPDISRTMVFPTIHDIRLNRSYLSSNVKYYGLTLPRRRVLWKWNEFEGIISELLKE